MSFQVQKGGKFQIDKGITNVTVGLGWQPAAKAGEAFDLDAHAFALVHPGGDASKAGFYTVGGKYPLTLTYANAHPDGDCVKASENGPKAFKTPGGEMVHVGDNRTGVGDGDDETIQIALGRLPAEVAEVAIWVTIYEGETRGQTFDRVADAYIRVLADGGRELCRYNLNEKFVGAQAVQVGSLVRGGAGWQFVAVGTGSRAGLLDILGQYTA